MGHAGRQPAWQYHLQKQTPWPMRANRRRDCWRWRQVYPRKQPPRPTAVASDSGHNPPLALQKRLRDLRRKARHAAPTAICFPLSGLRG
jgi:hypothetical protein